MKLKNVIVAGLALLVVGTGVTAGASGISDTYTVKSGDTLLSIARDQGTDIYTIAANNHQILDLNNIHVGDVVKLGKTTKAAVAPVETANSSYGVALLSRLVEAEAGTESYAGKVAVAEVVLNRVTSDQFPNRIEDVIYQNGQFSPVANGSLHTVDVTQESVDAVNEALTGTEYANGALYFYNPAVTGYHGWFESLTTTTVIGNHTFKR